jgi:dTDP-4-amino-4,6-dideoxygalactose transaminase
MVSREESEYLCRAHCENAAWLEERTFFVPCHPVYEIEHMEKIAEAIRKVLAAYAS